MLRVTTHCLNRWLGRLPSENLHRIDLEGLEVMLALILLLFGTGSSLRTIAEDGLSLCIINVLFGVYDQACQEWSTFGEPFECHCEGSQSHVSFVSSFPREERSFSALVQLIVVHAEHPNSSTNANRCQDFGRRATALPAILGVLTKVLSPDR